MTALNIARQLREVTRERVASIGKAETFEAGASTPVRT